MADIGLTNEERIVLELLGKLHVSQSKNINEATIRKKLHPKYRSELSKTIKSLHSKGLLRYYRSQNYSLTDEGKKIAEKKASELFNKTYGSLRILLLL
jgi:Mn-dependent DtxR family transcriptional regulator